MDRSHKLPQPAALHAVKLRSLKILLLFGSVAILLIWISEAWSGRLMVIDRFAYPVMVAVFGCAFFAIQYRPAVLPIAEKAAFLTLVLYINLLVQLIISGYEPTLNIYTLSTIAQWFPLVYIAAFIFLETRNAIIASIAIYLSMLIPIVAQIVIQQNAFIESEQNQVLFNMMASHPVYIMTLSVITRLKTHYVQAQQQADLMRAAANRDYLTGVANRRSIAQSLQHSLASASTRDARFCAILLDIDYFKQINDTHGHEVGDQVLIEVTECLRAEVRNTDVLGRWGGEEFIIIAPDADLSTGTQLAERLRSAIAAQPYEGIGWVTASFGVSESLAGDTPESLVRRADAALYLAKQRGRNRVEIT
jgi:diguanylate cyclase